MTTTRDIIINPKVMSGKPIIAGTRITVEHILELLSGGWSEPEILRQFPHLKKADIAAVLQYATALAKNEQVFPFPYETAGG